MSFKIFIDFCIFSPYFLRYFSLNYENLLKYAKNLSKGLLK
jgi:hypothetical protein